MLVVKMWSQTLLCAQPQDGHQGHRGAESSPTLRHAQAGQTQCGRCLWGKGRSGRERHLNLFWKGKLELDS